MHPDGRRASPRRCYVDRRPAACQRATGDRARPSSSTPARSRRRRRYCLGRAISWPERATVSRPHPPAARAIRSRLDRSDRPTRSRGGETSTFPASGAAVRRPSVDAGVRRAATARSRGPASTCPGQPSCGDGGPWLDNARAAASESGAARGCARLAGRRSACPPRSRSRSQPVRPGRLVSTSTAVESVGNVPVAARRRRGSLVRSSASSRPVASSPATSRLRSTQRCRPRRRTRHRLPGEPIVDVASQDVDAPTAIQRPLDRTTGRSMSQWCTDHESRSAGRRSVVDLDAAPVHRRAPVGQLRDPPARAGHRASSGAGLVTAASGRTSARRAPACRQRRPSGASRLTSPARATRRGAAARCRGRSRCRGRGRTRSRRAAGRRPWC